GGAEDSRQDHAACLLDAGIAPHLPVEPEEVVREEMQEGDHRDELPEVPPVLVGDLAVEPQHQRREIGEEGNADVEDGEKTVAAECRHDASGPGHSWGRSFATQRTSGLPPETLGRRVYEPPGALLINPPAYIHYVGRSRSRSRFRRKT